MNEIEQAAVDVALAERDVDLARVAFIKSGLKERLGIEEANARALLAAARLRYDRLVIGEMKDACLAAFRQWDSTPNAQAVEFAWALFHRDTYHQDSDEAEWKAKQEANNE